MAKSSRPNMSAYFRGRIDWHVNGMMSSGFGWNRGQLPAGVKRVNGDVTAREIVVEMQDGTVWKWVGGQYAARKVNGCYAPLMPKPVN